MSTSGGPLAQLRRIADAVEALPRVERHLEQLDLHVTEMSAEVSRMRSGVENLNGGVEVLNGGVDDLDAQFTGMRRQLDGLDGHLGEVKKLLSPPLQAIAGIGRLGNRLRNPPEPRDGS